MKSSSDDLLKPFVPSSTSPSPARTPSAHPSMCLPSEHPDPTRCPSSTSSVAIRPTHTSDPLTLFSPSCLTESPLPSRPLRDSPSHDLTPSNLPPFNLACPDGVASLPDKGKAKDPPPTLPPLSFSTSGLGYNIDDRSSSTPGPSSYRSTCPSLSSQSPPSSIESNIVQAHEPPTLTKVPSRTRSFSNISIQSTTPSMSKIRIKLAASSKAPVNLARRLLNRNKGDAAGPSVTGSNEPVDPLQNDLMPIEPGNCLFPWQTKDSTRASSPRAGVEAQAATVTIPDVPVVWYPDNHYLDGVPGSRGIGRSYSSPFPKSAFDVVPQVDFEDKFIPLPLHAQDLFDEMLPRELRLRVFSALISLHEEDHEQLKKSGKWSVLVATSSKNRWVGRNRAVRELVKLSRVSKLWRTLVFDGQLWQNVDLRAFPSTFLPSLVELSGPFIKNLDLSGHTLTAITLQGCAALTTQSLHGLLIRSPFLRSLNVKGLQAVTNATFDVLALCSQLASLNMSRCANIDGDGVRAFGAAVMARGARLALRELWLCGLQMIDDDALATLGKAAPHLEVLDLSYCRGLHNSALEAFVACVEGGEVLEETISLTSRQVGRDPWDIRRYTRRVTALRHLSLSSCVMLTDIACSNLAYSVPRLELLELAGIGHTLKDDGLVHLLATTPFIRKLDLEDASDITDAVLEVLTPELVVEGSTPSKTTTPPQPGHALEHLTVSSATNLTNDAFRALIRGCSNLRVLEADSTSISGTVLKEFVRQVCDRGINDAGLVVVDCRSVAERAIKDMVANSRPRKGWRSWDARKLGYLDGRDGEDLKVGQDECDEKRVVIKSFYSWQTVDAVRHVRERRKKTNKKSQCNSEQLSEPEDGVKLLGRMRWWMSGSRTSSGNSTPGEDSDRDGCQISSSS
ncbi:hypothetical protein JVT61DRAFT_5170 [Boletus reticuloceps]|uniref:F-box domain-containing protein n=1 Tax=Boletus reticuloceps TaxID=495285 RepID=A0A8I2YYC1_9AGAM|nr:hypothetical protein JVT61DRAFT_5170 [Boletus reticuloceps]